MPAYVPEQPRHRRTLAHQCPSCGRDWALRVTVVESGRFLTCRFCGDVWSVLPAVEST
jgi:uncharacterized Zn finger protein